MFKKLFTLIVYELDYKYIKICFSLCIMKEKTLLQKERLAK